MQATDKVQAGFLACTEVTDPTEHRAYDEWHANDHLPEQLPLPGIAWGQRWVATPECRTRWHVAEPPLDAVHYLTLYLLTAPVDQTLAAFRELAARLAARGRFHQARRAHLAAPFTLIDTRAAPRVRISPAAVPYRPHRGVHVVIEEVTETGACDDHERRLDVEVLPALLATPGIAGIWRFSSRSEAGRPPPVDLRVTVCWLDDEPSGPASEVAACWPSSPGMHPLLGGPFATRISEHPDGARIAGTPPGR